MADTDEKIAYQVGQLEPIGLEQMSAIRLMNRTDSKFVTDKFTLLTLLQQAGDDYFAQEIDGKRVAPYRTNYWDTPVHSFYLAHHNGRSPRKKVRVRTYIDSDLTFLEVKTKNNHGRTKKKRIQVEAPTEIGSAQCDAFLREMTPYGYKDLKPVLQNRFDRITLVNRGQDGAADHRFQHTFREFRDGGETGHWQPCGGGAQARRQRVFAHQGPDSASAREAFGIQQILHRHGDDQHRHQAKPV
jgi:hypothetical protein